MATVIRSLLLASLLVLIAAGDGSPPLYDNDFEKTPLGKPPADFLVLAGAFEVKASDGNQVLELPGDPLDSFGLLFGPADHDLVQVRASVSSAASGKRFPEFGIGCADAFGYKLIVLPGQQKLILRKGDNEIATAPYKTWKSGEWTDLSIRIERAGEAWRVTGMAGPAGGVLSHSVSITFDEKTQPVAGRGSIWGTPFSGKPIRFDNLRMTVTN